MKKSPSRDKLKVSNLDTYYAKKLNYLSLQQASPLFSGTLVDLGCGQMPYKEFILTSTKVTKYIGLDLENNKYGVTPDVSWNGDRIPFPDGSIDTVIATQVLEHLPNPEKTLLEVFRILKAGGIFFFNVPFLWPLHDVPYDEYRFTPFGLIRFLTQAGFTDVKIFPYGGWDASLATMLGLWARRRDSSEVVRECLSWIIKPFMIILYHIDKIPTQFSESLMVPGVWGIGNKNR